MCSLLSHRFGLLCFIFFFKQKTAYEMRISDWSSDVCSSDLKREFPHAVDECGGRLEFPIRIGGQRGLRLLCQRHRGDGLLANRLLIMIAQLDRKSVV